MTALQLPEAVLSWIGEFADAPVLRADRIPGGGVREGWFIDVGTSPADTRPLFLRCSAAPLPDSAAFHRLRTEAAVVRALHASGVRVAQVHAVHPTREAVLMERIPGRTWFSQIRDPQEQLDVARDFIRNLAAVHRLDPRALDLPALGAFGSARDIALARIADLRRRATGADGTVDPLVQLSADWLEQHVPDYDGPVVLVQGDTGPGNFMHENGRVTAVVDWELCHWGDPMDDIYDQSTAPGGAVTFKQILAHLESRLHLAPSFQRKLVRVPLGLDHPYWIADRDFDLEFHVRHIALPQPGDWRQLCIQLARLHSRRLDMTRPPWEIYVIEGLDNIEGIPRGSFAMLYKIHHAIVDGVAGAEMFTAVHDLTAQPPEVRAAPDAEAEPNPGAVGLVARGALNSLLRPTRLLRATVDTAPQVARLAWDTIGSALRGRLTLPAVAPPTRFGGTVGPHRVFDGRRYPLAEFKQARRAVAGATLNDVVLAVVAGALRRYLLDKDELPDRSLITHMPISVRSPGAPGGNQITLVAVSLDTDVEDPVERLASITAQTRLSKDASSVPARALVEMSEALPGALLGLGLRAAAASGFDRSVSRMANTMVSNVPGPQVPLYLAGARSVVQSGLPPIANGMGLVHGMGSYTGTINLSFVADRAMMPDPAFYAECLGSSYDELCAAGG